MEYNLEFFATIGHLMTGFGTIALAILLYRTLKHLAVSTHASAIQTEYKFRPWIGPTGVIRNITDHDKKRFEIMIKNFGDIPANDVKVSSIVKTEKITKDDLKSQTAKISLGPVLPNMEKKFWLDVDSKILLEAQDGIIHSGVLFEYPLSSGTSEYGLISEIDITTFSFVHKEMWTSSPPLNLT